MIKNIEDLKLISKSFPSEEIKSFTLECSTNQYNTLIGFLCNDTLHYYDKKNENPLTPSGVKIFGTTIIFKENPKLQEPLHYYITV